MTTMIAGAGGSGETPATIKIEAVGVALDPRYFQIFTPGREVSVLRKSRDSNGRNIIERDWFVETVNREAGTIGIRQGGSGNTNVKTIDVRDMFKWNMGIGQGSKFIMEGREYTCMEIEGEKVRLMATPDSVSPTGKVSIENHNVEMGTLINSSSWLLLPLKIRESDVFLGRKVIVLRSGNPPYYEGNWIVHSIDPDSGKVMIKSTYVAKDGQIGMKPTTASELVKWNNG